MNISQKEQTILNFLQRCETAPYLYLTRFINRDYLQRLLAMGHTVENAQPHDHLIIPLFKEKLLHKTMYIMNTSKLPTDGCSVRKLNYKIGKQVAFEDADVLKYIACCAQIDTPILVEYKGGLRILAQNNKKSRGFDFNKQSLVLSPEDFLDILRLKNPELRKVRVINCLTDLKPYYKTAVNNILNSLTPTIEYYDILQCSIERLIDEMEHIDNTTISYKKNPIYNICEYLFEKFNNEMGCDYSDDFDKYIKRKSIEQTKTHNNWSMKYASSNTMFFLIRTLTLNKTFSADLTPNQEQILKQNILDNMKFDPGNLLPSYTDQNGDSQIIGNKGDLKKMIELYSDPSFTMNKTNGINQKI